MAKEKTKLKKKIDKEDKKIVKKITFYNELEKISPDIKKKLIKFEKDLIDFNEVLKKLGKDKYLGTYVTPKFKVENGNIVPEFKEITFTFVFDDFEKNISEFTPEIFFGKEFEKLLTKKIIQDNDGDKFAEYSLKSNSNIKFKGVTISEFRESCFDSNYKLLKEIGNSIIFEDDRNFLKALKTIEIHKNMLLRKFERYVVAYVGGGSWVRGEKSNDFDVFIIIDDTDIKTMSRMQVKEQLTRIIYQMMYEVANITGEKIHPQIYLLTNFWDALKDAHPVIFTFLRDGLPFYDRGIFTSWKELLKLGKIKPSQEAIDIHMSIGSELIKKTKDTFREAFMNEIYYAILSPSQAILMMKGFNPTTPKETVKMFKEVLLNEEKSISKKSVEILERTVKKFKELEHTNLEITGKELDKFMSDAEEFLTEIKKMFEKISNDKLKEGVTTIYNQLLSIIKESAEYETNDEKIILSNFEKDFLDTRILPKYIKDLLKDIKKTMSHLNKNKLNEVEINKTMKDIRIIISEIKNYKENLYLNKIINKKVQLNFENKKIELFNYNDKIYLNDLTNNKFYLYQKDKFKELKDEKKINELKELELNKLKEMNLDKEILEKIKEIL